MFSEIEVDELRKNVKSYMSDSRYKHTLGVENAAIKLGSVLLPELVAELRVAALLHDITKEMPFDEQFSLLNSAGAILSYEDKATLPALHSFSAVPFIEMNFHRYATNNVLSSVANHTLGAERLSLFDKIIFIADFIEDGRTYDTCIATAKYLNDNISDGNTPKENLNFLNQSILMAIDSTVSSVLRKNQMPHSRTLSMKSNLTK